MSEISRKRGTSMCAAALLLVLSSNLPAAAGPAQPVEVKLVASDGEGFDDFGRAVAIDGDRLAVMATQEDTAGPFTGSIYLFERDPLDVDSWTEVAKLSPALDDPEYVLAPESPLGLSGDTLAIGIDGEVVGRVLVYEIDELGIPALGEELTTGRRRYGASLAIEGDRLLVGSPGSPEEAILYHRAPDGSWIEELRLPDPNSKSDFGKSVALSSLRFAVAEGPDSDWWEKGTVYIREQAPGGEWIEVAAETFGDRVYLGWRLAMHKSFLAASDSLSGAVTIFERGSGGGDQWERVRDHFGTIGDPGGSLFGSTLDLEGMKLVVGAPNDDLAGNGTGRAFLYHRNQGGAGAWDERAEIVPSDLEIIDNFGTSVSLSDNTLVVGSPLDDDVGFNSGSVYVYRLGPMTSVAGSCPGTVTITVRGATPDGQIAIAWDQGYGRFTIPGGDCPGTVLDLASPVLVGIFAADGTGSFEATRDLGAFECTGWVQAVDVTSCAVTNVTPLR